MTRTRRGRAPRTRLERVVCPACGRTVAGRVPRGGDGSGLKPVPHNATDTEPGHVCPGHWQMVYPTSEA